MISDINELEIQDFNAQICIVGSGAAGIAIAKEFIGSQTQVILLESGSKIFEKQTQSLYNSKLVGLPHHSINHGRARILGGTTTLWAGQALPLYDIDFQYREWVFNSGWPFDRQYLETFYRRAESIMNLPAFSYDEREQFPGIVSPPAFDHTRLQSAISQFSPTPNFAECYYSELKTAANIHVLLHANVTNIQTNPEATHVEHIDIKSLVGKTGYVKAKYYIVCCGAIETARLLLASNTIEKDGLGNGYNLVGRYFQDHPQYCIGPILPKNRQHFMEMFNSRKQKKVKYQPKLIASPDLQRQMRIQNVIAEVCYPPTEESAIEAAKVFLKSIRQPDLRSKLPKAFKNILKHPDELLKAAHRYFITNQPVQDTSVPAYLGIGIEQQPNPNSHVYLGDEMDALGMRRICLDWQLTDADRLTMQVFTRVVAQEFERLDIGTINLHNFYLPEMLDDLAGYVGDAAHHIGTARMCNNPTQGVVDSNCRVHNIDNLYIGSGAVFPTGGASNPTLTIIALCLRIADQLKQRL
jgi:choline dehydrogenase-like flavoprotein